MDKARKFQRSNGVLFTNSKQVAAMTLADGFRFVGLVRDSSPVALPISEQGIWHVDIPEMLADGKWPVAVLTVDSAHVKAFEKLKPALVNQMLDAMLADIPATPTDTIRGEEA